MSDHIVYNGELARAAGSQRRDRYHTWEHLEKIAAKVLPWDWRERV